MSFDPLSPPQTASTHHPPEQHSLITHKSHRLRKSPVPGEGSTFIPVVKFSQPFTQRNALRGVKPVYGTTPPELIQEGQEGDIVSIPRPIGGRSGDGRGNGWTISITTSSSNPTDEELQVEIQQHFEQPQIQQPRSHAQELLGGAPPTIRSPPPIPPIPKLSHDRIVIKKEDFSRIRIKSSIILTLGLLFPPLWVLMGWSHILDGFILPPTGEPTNRENTTNRGNSVNRGDVVCSKGESVGGLSTV